MGQPTGAKILPVKSFDSGVINVRVPARCEIVSPSLKRVRVRVFEIASELVLMLMSLWNFAFSWGLTSHS